MSFSVIRISLCSLIVLISLAGFSLGQGESQIDLGTEVTILDGLGAKRLNCSPTNKLVVTNQEFRELLNDEKCFVLKGFEADFSKHTLINYSVRGDCNMSVTHKIFRNDKTKTYTVEVKNYWGKCRAGGFYRGWIVIDKIPADYEVELKEIQIDGTREKDKTNVLPLSKIDLAEPPPVIYSETADLNGCIPMFGQKKFVIKDKETYLKNIRIDAQTERCKENAKYLDFENYSYIGLLISSGYCRYPKGLAHRLTKNISAKTYTLDVSYADPEGQVCRALSRYDLWVQVPKLQDGFEVVFQITPKPSDKSSKVRVSQK